MLTERDIHQIVERVVQGYAPDLVGLFGSYAIGRSTQASDLDLLVIKRTAEPVHARVAAVRSQLVGVLHPMDIVVVTPEEFEARRREEYSFTWVVARQAKVLFRAQGVTLLADAREWGRAG
ncbi:nucleotidyltransferase domain-containing protein [Corallococcus exercitus]|uniref:nucleotidyltransferase domain-containing protein n=1 Tax=Corallococcus exercitus TaxID=2316736 RepID=UPI0035D490CC